MRNFITIEGCEGVGKSTQLSLLRKYCQANNYNKIIFTREPGGSIISEAIRNIILSPQYSQMTNLTEAMLYAAARAQHVEEKILPALNDGYTVICDRYVDSSYAYQGFARGLGLKLVQELNSIAVGKCMPQFTVFLDLNPKDAFNRKGGADHADRLETENLSFYEKVYEGYKQIILNDPDRFIVIDASLDAQHTTKLIVEQLTIKGIL